MNADISRPIPVKGSDALHNTGANEAIGSEPEGTFLVPILVPIGAKTAFPGFGCQH
jgi:hypothetical protein